MFLSPESVCVWAVCSVHSFWTNPKQRAWKKKKTKKEKRYWSCEKVNCICVASGFLKTGTCMIFRINFFANSMVQLFICDIILLIYTANQSTNQQPSRRRLQRNFRYSGFKIKCLCSIKLKKNIEGSSIWFVFDIYSY